VWVEIAAQADMVRWVGDTEGEVPRDPLTVIETAADQFHR
jgi:hypothetical protein